MAAPSPMAPAMSGVPASNLAGSAVVPDLSKVTELIMSPPPCYGGIRSSRSAFAVQHADAGRAEQLVAREGVEVAVERPHVDRHVRDGLRAVDEHRDAAGVGEADDRRPRD